MIQYSFFCNWWRICSSSLQRRWRIDWGGDCLSAEGTPRRCYQTTGFTNWRPQHDVCEAVHTRSRSRKLLEQAFVDSNIHVQMRFLLALFLIRSRLYFIFTCRYKSSPNLLPLSCLPLGIGSFVRIAPLLSWKKLSWWTLKLIVSFLLDFYLGN